ncbi:MAG TPA: hypothetical protein VMO26_13015 [Vicinamibacterales bacterium]|nr:hypothetical protein [Vicinamibacterales bacterium]
MVDTGSRWIVSGLLSIAGVVALSCGASSVGSAGPSPVPVQQATEVTVEGELRCLPHRPGFPTTFECTIGLREAADRHYALRNLKEGAIIGDRMRISGRFTPGPDDPYDVLGTIDIESQVRLSGGA